MVSLGLLFFLGVFFMAMWTLVFLFSIVIPMAINLSLLNVIAPKFVRKLSGLDDEK